MKFPKQRNRAKRFLPVRSSAIQAVTRSDIYNWPGPRRAFDGTDQSAPGGVDGSFFTAHRRLPWASRHEHADSNVTGCEFAAPVQQYKAVAAIVNVVTRVIR
jgi:hypothetical protein